MAIKVLFRPQAEADLLALYRYIAGASSLATAGNYIDRIETACMSLAEFPNRGTKRDDLAPGLRTIAFERRVTIAYRVLRTRVDIVTISYAGRDFENAFRDS
ncbi:type II toxin-antitoxin system RelE/ParE family toxin [Bradyrhizobium sp.]|uniref:type II toxin-antitoxin system RelE/ParE family toxin n=1 Tax=Bradyrhizobium sp. TaxID=376 RepID=UPI003C23F6D6